MMLKCSFAILLLALPLAAQVTPKSGPMPYEFKGNRLGMTLAQFHAENDLDNGEYLSCRIRDEKGQLKAGAYAGDPCLLDAACSLASKGFASCNDWYSQEVAGVEVQLANYKFIDGRLYEIEIAFSEDGFDQVEEALRTKFGGPVRGRIEVLQNVFGARYDKKVFAWSNGVSHIGLWQWRGDGENSLLLYRHAKLYRLVEARTPKAKIDF